MRLPIQPMQSVLLQPGALEENGWFRSSVIDFTPDEVIVVLLPNRKDRVATLPKLKPGDAQPGAEGGSTREEEDDRIESDQLFNKGSRIKVEMSFPDGIRQFDSVIRRLELSFGGAIHLEWPTRGNRIQRRDYVRVDARYQSGVRFIDPDQGRLAEIKGITLDLSAGGARLLLARPIPDETQVELEIEAEPLQGQTLQARVVRSAPHEQKGRNRKVEYWVAVQFVEIDEGLRNRIMQFVFEIQRSQMRKSL